MKHLAVPTVNLLIVKEGQILLSRRANTGWMDGYLVLPGGHVEANETPVDAIIREAKEELGLDITATDLSFVCVAVRNQEPVEHMAFEFKLDGSKFDPKNMEPEKCSELAWISLDNLSEDIVPDFQEIIEKAYKSPNTYIEIGWPDRS